MVYRTINTYDFGYVRFAFGHGTVGTVTYINLNWEEKFPSHGEYWWEGKVNIYYSDIFEDSYDIGVESSMLYAYYHYWEESKAIKISNYWIY